MPLCSLRGERYGDWRMINAEAYKYVETATKWLNETYGSLPLIAVSAILTKPEIAAIQNEMDQACGHGDVELTKENARRWMLAIQACISKEGAEGLLQQIDRARETPPMKGED